MNPVTWSRIKRIEGDITRMDCDAIVNAANTSLRGGGGVDGAIHRAAGPELLAECIGIGGCPVGEARITRGYRLPARHVIHTVGPIYRDGRQGEAELLASCHVSSLKLAVEAGLRTVAFPAISCGVYGYPIDEAARIALTATADFLDSHSTIDGVTFVLFSHDAIQTFDRAHRRLSQGE